MIPPGDGANELNHRDDHAPHPARDHFAVSAENLERQGGAVSAGGGISNGAQGKNHDAEAAEAAEAVVAS